jgi:hypothetical protein
MNIKKTIIGFFVLLSLTVTLASNVFATQSVDKAWCEESLQIRYDGYIQFTANYIIPNDPGYGLVPNNIVKQGYINFTRDGESVIGGRKYTSVSPSMSSNAFISTSATAWDSLNPFASKTKFYYGWAYWF